MPKLVAKHLDRMEPGRHGDGGGLYFLVRGNSKTWIFRYRDRLTGKQRDMGLGSFPEVTLADARNKAAQERASIQKGESPLEARQATRQADRSAREAEAVAAARAKTFGQCCDAYIASHRTAWRNAKHAAQWGNTLTTYCGDLLGLPVAAIDEAHVMGVLEPIWTTKAETASRVRQRIERVLDYAKARKYRHGDNPARWRGHLDNLLPKTSKVTRVKPRAAVPYADMGAFMVKLRALDTLASRALQFQILTAARPSEACNAQWNEIDLKGKVWTVPGERMKAGREHRVPLSDDAVRLLELLHPASDGYVFPSKKDKPLTIAATLKVTQTLAAGMTAHGFRSSFRDWAADRTAYPREVAEAALAHQLKDKTEAAYLRTDMLERRQRMMQDWAAFCGAINNKDAKVTPIRRKTFN